MEDSWQENVSFYNNLFCLSTAKIIAVTDVFNTHTHTLLIINQ